jgi:hypothetical protein
MTEDKTFEHQSKRLEELASIRDASPSETYLKTDDNLMVNDTGMVTVQSLTSVSQVIITVRWAI